MCVLFAGIVGNRNNKFNLNNEPSDSSLVEDYSNVKENHEFSHSPKMNDYFKGKAEDNNVHGDCCVDDLVSETKEYHGKLSFLVGWLRKERASF